MNKITLLKITLLCSVFSLAQNIDTTQYQKVYPPKSDTVKNFYNPNNNGVSNDTIKEFYPSEPKQNQPAQQTPFRNNPIRKPIPEESPLMKKLYFGCNLALRFYAYSGYNIFYYDLSPNVGYKITDNFSAGIQIVYNNTIESAGGRSASYSIVGGGVFVRYVILKFMFLQAEYDVLTTPPSYQFGARAVSDEKLIGFGLKNHFSEKVSYYLTLMYDITPTINSPYYANPLVYRVGVAYNF